MQHSDLAGLDVSGKPKEKKKDALKRKEMYRQIHDQAKWVRNLSVFTLALTFQAYSEHLNGRHSCTLCLADKT